MFSIVIPSYNNLDYLKLCIASIKKNSKFNHEIIVHVNDGSDGTLDFVKGNNLNFTFTKENVGLCSGVNLAATKSTTKFILYSHDDMYFCPLWDVFLKKEIDNLRTNNFYLSGTMIEQKGGHISYDCGETFKDFNEQKLLINFEKLKFFDHQGSHWAPHLIHKDMWNKIGGFSEEFNPGIGSDPDLNMKLWNAGVRIFKGLGNFKVYHFGSIVLRKKKNFKRNKGSRTFLKKWGISPIFFVKHYLKGGVFKDGRIECQIYTGPLSIPSKNLAYWLDLIKCKLAHLYLKVSK